MHSKIDVDQEWLGRWRNYFLSYYDEARVDEKVCEVIEFVEKYVDNSLVAVSGGKDSMTMLHIIYSNVSNEIMVFHWDHGSYLMPRWIENEIVKNIFKVAPKARILVKKYSFGEHPLSRIDWRPWYRAFYGVLDKLTRRYSIKYHLIGIRAEESSSRRTRGRVVKRGNWAEVYPIYNFTWRDVWSYIFKHNVPVPRIYFVYAKLLGWERVRLTTFHDQEFMKYGSPNIDSYLLWREKNQPT